ncbi:MAG: cadmium resistance transporter [Chlorogloeopsis fritschii C42_A2020_084]|uniref:cadmium resistance transporter n=1 Tax=Chlorogloeopsis fritschii TaxID=1124 RepID=UPI0019F51EA6|nr:cadmium resistance transporter [Chlorogloeopsis fritschii]MBF2005795.1 cadmium resistance transporter [Chlorogloeopsis fritschii C42_A2020_084]
MSNLTTLITEAIIAFTATNIDDFIILLLFFSQLNHQFRRRHIFIGQYLGFLAIIIVSLPGFLGGLVVPRAWIGLLGILPIVIGIKQLVSQEVENSELQTVTTDFNPSTNKHPIINFILSIFSPQTYKVAAIIFANGGDNVGIYIPLFAGYRLVELLVIIIVFLIMKGVWYTVTYLLARQKKVAQVLSRYGKTAVPFVLIGLGLYIMYERGKFSLLAWK